MSIVAQKRIIKDIRDIEKNPLTQHGIFTVYDENNIFNIKVLMIGPENTPYEKGFFFFDLKFPHDYPFKPPLVKLCTLDGENRVRFNPNLYVCGKVCLSIINTWSGPSWTSCQTLSSVLLSIQSLLNEMPLRNEPGFENEHKSKCKIYNRIIQYHTIRVAVCNVLDNIPSTFETFYPIITDFFFKNFDWYIKYLQKYKKYDGNYEKSPIYSMELKYNYKMIESNIKKIYENLNLSQIKNIDLNKDKFNNSSYTYN